MLRNKQKFVDMTTEIEAGILIASLDFLLFYLFRYVLSNYFVGISSPIFYIVLLLPLMRIRGVILTVFSMSSACILLTDVYFPDVLLLALPLAFVLSLISFSENKTDISEMENIDICSINPQLRVLLKKLENWQTNAKHDGDTLTFYRVIISPEGRSYFFGISPKRANLEELYGFRLIRAQRPPVEEGLLSDQIALAF